MMLLLVSKEFRENNIHVRKMTNYLDTKKFQRHLELKWKAGDGEFMVISKS